MTDDDLSPELADVLRDLGAGPEPTPTRELVALFVQGAPGRRRGARLAQHGVPFGIAVKVLLGTGVLGAASVGAVHVVKHNPLPHLPHRAPAVVSPTTEQLRHRSVTETRKPAAPTSVTSRHPVKSTWGDDRDAQPPENRISPRSDSSDGDPAPTQQGPNGGSGD
jgi:hypothetical protein